MPSAAFIVHRPDKGRLSTHPQPRTRAHGLTAARRSADPPWPPAGRPRHPSPLHVTRESSHRSGGVHPVAVAQLESTLIPRIGVDLRDGHL